MNSDEIVKRLEKLNFNKQEYWVVAGAAMVLHRIKEATSDIDLGCTTKLANILEEKYQAMIGTDGTRSFHIGDDLEIFENWLDDKIVFISGIPTVSIKGLISMKRKLGREKDLKDIERINSYLEKHDDYSR